MTLLNVTTDTSRTNEVVRDADIVGTVKRLNTGPVSWITDDAAIKDL